MSMRTRTHWFAALLVTAGAALVGGAPALVTGAQEARRQPNPAAASESGHDSHEPHGRSKQETLLQDPLHAVPGKQATLLRIEYPPGWVGRRHYHTGDVILYVLEGRFVVDVDGAKRTTIGPGEAYHEAVKSVMQARNGSATEPTRLLLFQVGGKGEQLTVTVD
jgi:quercetin dioxygenase-like cupin family protein